MDRTLYGLDTREMHVLMTADRSVWSKLRLVYCLKVETIGAHVWPDNGKTSYCKPALELHYEWFSKVDTL